MGGGGGCGVSQSDGSREGVERVVEKIIKLYE
jgi:hypothetical protein